MYELEYIPLKVCKDEMRIYIFSQRRRSTLYEVGWLCPSPALPESVRRQGFVVDLSRVFLLSESYLEPFRKADHAMFDVASVLRQNRRIGCC